MAGKLYTYPNNTRAYKVLIAAEYAGAKIEVLQEPPEFQLGVTNATPEFLEKFPSGKVPAFLSADGKALNEANAIAQYVAGNKLFGSDDYERAVVTQWITFADAELTPAVSTWVYPTLGIIKAKDKNTDKAKADLAKSLAYLNTTLATRTFLVGERVSQADIAVAVALLPGYQRVFAPDFRAAYGNVNRWFTTCVNQPQFKSVLGDVTLATEEAKADKDAFALYHPEKAKDKKDKKEKKEKDEKKEKKEKKDKDEKKDKKEKKEKKDDKEKKEKKEDKDEKKEEKPKEEKKKDKKKKDDDDMEDDPPLYEEEKKEKPTKYLTELPKSPFDLEEWKRVYSNDDTISKAIPWFWEHYDAEGYTMVYAEYLYPEELTQIFMTANLVSGMFQRLDSIRKFVFGSVLIFGEANNNTIKGVWIYRGKDNIFDKTESNIDSPSYKWTVLDPAAAETKDLVNQYWSWGETKPFDGPLAFNQGKVFK